MKTQILPPFAAAFSFLLSPAVLAAPDFKKDVTPIFKRNCYECHSTKGKKKGDLALDDPLSIQASGHINAGKGEGSHLYNVIISLPDSDKHMPPKKMLSKKDAATIKAWIDAGAKIEPLEAEPAPATPATPAAPVQSWKNTEGKEIKASFVKLDGTTLHLKGEDGRAYAVPLAKLSPESQEQAKKAAAGTK